MARHELSALEENELHTELIVRVIGVDAHEQREGSYHSIKVHDQRSVEGVCVAGVVVPSDGVALEVGELSMHQLQGKLTELREQLVGLIGLRVLGELLVGLQLIHHLVYHLSVRLVLGLMGLEQTVVTCNSGDLVGLGDGCHG